MNVRAVWDLARRAGIGAVCAGLLVLGAGSVALAEPAAQAAATCTMPPQGIVVTIDVPGPGAVLSPGSNVVVQGVAYDATSPAGPAIDRVAIFLGARDAGGIFWGDALLQQPSPQLGSNLSAAGWSRRSPTIPTGSGSREIFAYAHSLYSGRESVASVTVFLGAAPTAVRGQVPTPVPAPLPPCTPAPTATATSTPAPPPPTATPLLTVSTPTSTPAAPAPAAPPAGQPAMPVAPAPAAPPAAAPPAAAAAPATAPAGAQPTAPRGGGIPVELGLLVIGIGAGVVGGGMALRRRERSGGPGRG